MTLPSLFDNGGNNWDKVDWNDPHAGTYTDLCPNQSRADFEYGSLLIANMAKSPSPYKILGNMPLSKIKRELDQLYEALNRISLETAALFYEPQSMRDPLAIMKLLVRHRRDQLDTPHKRVDISRHQLKEDAWSIWSHHGGDVADEKFEEYVSRLLIETGFVSDDRKDRVNLKAVVREIRDAAKVSKPRTWSLWD